MYVYCDFDGTISLNDVTDQVLERFAAKEWIRLEQDWEAGLITSAECMRSQIGLLDVSISDLNAFLDSLEIDPDFAAFAAFCASEDLKLTIVSDGVDWFIRRVLSAHGLGHLHVQANRLTVVANGDALQYRLDTPFARPECAAGSGVCKCALIHPTAHHFYVGDGRSDFCVSQIADRVFAKKKLAAYCTENAIPFTPYTTFREVQTAIEVLLQPRPARIPRLLAKTA
ncbi:MtnX-like HAD-IB family phosphatase [Rhizobium sp. AG855]|uniref:MtnX-like HAD-IB family phosphatase n=1 Tax=Rhizobium sp. AG855 TaxID=2183898 RepID=UPI000E732554|nr:MtnX-like HAD-IB family phosphatase [Rhizobium sp. AG855]RKE77398.1 HAD superfamily phosphoserine phosphatase-like hydrolase/2,3-diketo-5-methylthio-1-phosphopentane phosphatase [Rhizobium sp. AG855]